MRILIACEYSGTVRDAFTAQGHYAMSADLIPTESPGPHYVGDVRKILNDGWDLLIAHPPCTYISCVAIQHFKRDEHRMSEALNALDFVRELLYCNIPHICVENPKGLISKRIRQPDQIIQPYYFGDNASKATCLWLKRLPLLLATKYIIPRYVNNLPRWANQTDKGDNKLSGSLADRGKIRAKTYKGIALAMASQWSNLKD